MNLFDKDSKETIEIILDRRKRAFTDFLANSGCQDCPKIMHCQRNEFEAEWCSRFSDFYNEEYGKNGRR